jgi:hypothetical protein
MCMELLGIYLFPNHGYGWSKARIQLKRCP